MLELLIVTLSAIQSIAGIGLLIIGTPILLILNYHFFEILNILLPCSIFISLLQITNIKKISKSDKKMIFFSLPFVVIGILIINFIQLKINIKIFIGISIMLVLLLKILNIKEELLRLIFIKKKNITFSIIGLFHGLTNAGGSLISLLFLTNKKGKEKIIKSCIVFSYLLFALTQYITINIIIGEIKFDLSNINLLIFTIIGFFLGKKLFPLLKKNNFILMLNFIVFFAAIILILF